MGEGERKNTAPHRMWGQNKIKYRAPRQPPSRNEEEGGAALKRGSPPDCRRPTSALFRPSPTSLNRSRPPQRKYSTPPRTHYTGIFLTGIVRPCRRSAKHHRARQPLISPPRRPPFRRRTWGGQNTVKNSPPPNMGGRTQ